jgi:hypothetical protein
MYYDTYHKINKMDKIDKIVYDPLNYVFDNI